MAELDSAQSLPQRLFRQDGARGSQSRKRLSLGGRGRMRGSIQRWRVHQEGIDDDDEEEASDVESGAGCDEGEENCPGRGFAILLPSFVASFDRRHVRSSIQGSRRIATLSPRDDGTAPQDLSDSSSRSRYLLSPSSYAHSPRAVQSTRREHVGELSSSSWTPSSTHFDFAPIDSARGADHATEGVARTGVRAATGTGYWISSAVGAEGRRSRHLRLARSRFASDVRLQSTCRTVPAAWILALVGSESSRARSPRLARSSWNHARSSLRLHDSLHRPLVRRTSSYSFPPAQHLPLDRSNATTDIRILHRFFPSTPQHSITHLLPPSFLPRRQAHHTPVARPRKTFVPHLAETKSIASSFRRCSRR